MRLIYIQGFLLILGTTFGQANCDKYKDGYVPKNLDDALTYLDCVWPTEDKLDFKSKDERDAVTDLHMGTGLGIRNDWGLWSSKNSLYRYFKSKGIFHPDDVSSIILTSFHRQLNNKDIEFDKQVQYYKDYWEEARKRQKQIDLEMDRKAQIEYKTYSIGDSVKIAYSVSKNGGAVFAYRIQKDPDLGDEPNCFVTGIIKSKRIRKKKDFLLRILITDICGNREAYGGDDRLFIGQEREFNVASFKIYRD